MTVHTFAAANTQSGFTSLFSEFTSRTDAHIYLIKGGPGTGKSTFMKRVAHAADEKGLDVEQIHCSSDADSLDGVYVPTKSLILLDATAPHCADPVYPAVVETILPFGSFWNEAVLAPHKSAIIRLTDEISASFKHVYKYLAAAGEVRKMMNHYLEELFREKAADEQIGKLLRREAVIATGNTPKPSRRFVSALTGAGHLLYEDLLRVERTVVIEDSYDCTYLYMAKLEQTLAALGQERILLLNPLCPEHIDHIVLPKQNLAFLTKNPRCPLSAKGTLKNITMKSMLDKEGLAAVKNKLSFGKKVCADLYAEVQQILTSEKALHDELETYYIAAMDFKALDRAAEEFISQNL